MKRHFITRILAAVLAVFLLSSCTPWRDSVGEDTAIRAYAADDGSDTPDDGSDAPDGSGADQTPQDVDAAQRIYRDGRIHLYHFRQLMLVGTDTPVTDGDASEDTVGLGQPISDDAGQPVVYAKDAHYCLEGDIVMPSDKAWRLPDDFTGDFTAADNDAGPAGDEGQDQEQGDNQDGETPVSATPLCERLYDAASDTVFIQNLYQLKTLDAANRVEIPVMSGDWNAETFGTGRFLYPDGEAGGYLTYSPGHQYVLSAAFSAENPAVVSPALRMPVRAQANPNIDHVDGRDYFSQVVANIGGKDYILIGDRQQLQALDTGKDKVAVHGPVYQVAQKYVKVGTLDYEWQDDGEPELIYPGDADLIAGLLINGQNSNFDSSAIFNDGSAYHKLGTDSLGDGIGKRTVYCTVNPATGQADSSQTSNPYENMTYSRSANYIVFRDIDLQNEDWTPLMFNGSMYGVKATGSGSLWDEGKTALNITGQSTR